jgi:predicted thioesterase
MLIGDHKVVEVGKELVRHLTVDGSRAIDFMGPEIRVYATPAMIEDAEFACRDLLLTMMGSGQDSVGTYVEFFHVGSASIEADVALRVTIVSSTDRRVMFEMAFTYRDQVIGHGRHERAIVSIERLKKRLLGEV